MKLKFNFGALAVSGMYVRESDEDNHPIRKMNYRMWSLSTLINAGMLGNAGHIDAAKHAITTIKRI